MTIQTASRSSRWSLLQSRWGRSLLLHRHGAASGFTLTEALLVLIIAGVLAAIAAPGWLTFMNRQRVSSANAQVLQLLREAQTEAIAKRTTYGVLLDPADPDGPTITMFTTKDQDVANVGNIVEISSMRLGESDGKNEGLAIASVPNNINNQYRFNFDGSVDETFIPARPAGTDYVFKIEVSKDGSRRCVIVETLLGAMREGQGDECDADS